MHPCTMRLLAGRPLRSRTPVFTSALLNFFVGVPAITMMLMPHNCCAIMIIPLAWVARLMREMVKSSTNRVNMLP